MKALSTVIATFLNSWIFATFRNNAPVKTGKPLNVNQNKIAVKDRNSSFNFVVNKVNTKDKL
jgi:hypothetical protein